MKNGYPSKDMGKSKAPSMTQPSMSQDAKAGGKHLREHMAEKPREVDRSYCTPNKDRH